MPEKAVDMSAHELRPFFCETLFTSISDRLLLHGTVGLSDGIVSVKSPLGNIEAQMVVNRAVEQIDPLLVIVGGITNADDRQPVAHVDPIDHMDYSLFGMISHAYVAARTMDRDFVPRAAGTVTAPGMALSGVRTNDYVRSLHVGFVYVDAEKELEPFRLQYNVYRTSHGRAQHTSVQMTLHLSGSSPSDAKDGFLEKQLLRVPMTEEQEISFLHAIEVVGGLATSQDVDLRTASHDMY